MTMSHFKKIKELHKKFTEIPVPVYDIARSEGIEVSEEPMMYAGRIFKVNNKYKIVIDADDMKTRQRFTLAHELAHYYLHKHIIDKKSRGTPHGGIKDNSLYRGDLDTALEVDANQFAAELLMPLEEIYKVIKSYEKNDQDITITKIAEIFNVSKSALRMRLGIPAQ